MKLFLFCVCIANLFSAQNADLLNTNWKITRIVSEVRPDQFPPNAPVTNLTVFSATASNQLNSTFFNTVGGSLTYMGNNSFTVNSRACTLADYMDDNGEVNQFFNSICNFFGSSGPLYYFITSTGTEKTMVIGNTIFEELHFTASSLLTKENKISNFFVAPNPVKDILTVQNSSGITSAELFDFSGRKVYEIKSISAKSLNIDMQNFKTGIYFIKLNNDKTYKIIKE